MIALGTQIESTVVTDLVFIFVSAAVVALVVQRLKLAAIPTYLIAGILIGPHALGLIEGDNVLGEIAHLAVVFLLFGIGLELHLSILRHNLVRMMLVGVLSTVISMGAGTVLLQFASFSIRSAVVMAMAFALSSTAVVMRIIVERRELRHNAGRLSLSILVVQDILVVLMLALLPVLAAWNLPAGEGLQRSVSWTQLLLQLALKLVGVIVLIVAARKILPFVLTESLRARSLEVMLVVGIAGALLAARITQALGFSLELGAFLAGFILAGTPFRHQLGSQVGTVRDLFNALFFTTLGMTVEPMAVLEHCWVFVVGLIALLVVKTAVMWFSNWCVGVPMPVAIAVAFSLAQAGEFSLILLNRATGLALIDHEILAMGVAIIVASLILTPGLVSAGRRIAARQTAAMPAPWIKHVAFLPDREQLPGQERKHVIVAGYGPVGRSIVQMLGTLEFDATVIETNPRTHRELLAMGKAAVFGDVSDYKVLLEAGLDHASAVVLTFADYGAILSTCRMIKSIRKDIPVACRVLNLEYEALLKEIGVECIIVEEQSVGRLLQDGLKAMLR